jgi:Leucine-rich repeat (LRR) protein
MRKFFCLFGLLVLSASSYAVQGWMWFNQFPWVYSHEDENWIYVATEIEVSLYDGGKWSKQDDSYISNLGWVWMNRFPWGYSNKENKWIYISSRNLDKIYAYGVWNREWSELESYKHDWDKQYAKWIQNPEPYGGWEVLQQIKEAKESASKELYLWDNNITDISPLAGLTNLTELDLEVNKISDITPLDALTNLSKLYLWDNNVSDISPLAGLTNLTELSLWGNNISDITPLAGLTNLSKLSLAENIVSDISPLAGLTNLTELYLADNDLSESQKSMLEQALPYTSISWSNYTIVKDYSLNSPDDDIPWNEKTWDEKLTIWMQAPGQYGGLDVIKEIDQAWKNQSSELDLWGMAIKDISPLSELTNLRVLYLHSNRDISDLSPLANLTKLEKLTLSNNYIFDLSPLSGLVNLIDLDVSHNRFVSDVSPLFGLKKLKYLDVSYTIPDNQKEMLRIALPNTLIDFGSF